MNQIFAESPKSTASGDNGRGWLAHPVVLAFALVILTVAVFYPVRHHDFINFDDPDYFTANEHVRAGITGAGLAWAFRTGYSGNWHPLTWVSLMLDAQWFGTGPAGPHLVNLAWHLANTALLFLLLRRLTKTVWPAAVVAALFALHPLHVESVAWVAERKDLLSTFFLLLSLWAYAAYAEGLPRGHAQAGGAARSTSRHRTFYLAALVAFALGLMSKPMLVTLPFLLLLLDFWPLNRTEFSLTAPQLPSLLREKIPFFGLTAVSCIVTYFVQKRSGAVQSLLDLSFGQRVENAVVSYARYLGKTIWPTQLATPYPHPGHWPISWVLLGVAVLAGFSLVAWLSRRRFPFVTVGWFWFFGTLIPVIGLIQVGAQSMADRYTYVPLIGIFIAIVWSARALSRFTAIAAAVVVCLCAIRARTQLTYWRDSETLFRHAIAVTTNNWLAYYNLGWYLDGQGRLAEALDNYRQAVTIKPNCAEAWNNMGYVLASNRQYENALGCFQTALRVRPGLTDARNNLGRALAELGRTDEAIAQYRLALEQQPDHVGVLNNLGLALTQKGQFTEALQLYEKALRVNPKQPATHYHLATVLARLGRVPEALAHYEAAVQQKPDYASAQDDLGLALAMLGKPDQAIEHLRQAVRLQPDNTFFRCNLGKLLASQQRFGEAIPELEAALRLAPNNPDAHNALGSALATNGQLEEAIRHFQEALKYRPDNAGTHYNLARALASQQKYEQAIQHYEQALRLNPNFGPARADLQALKAAHH